MHHIADEHLTPEEWYANKPILRETYPEHSDLHILHVTIHAKIDPVTFPVRHEPVKLGP